MKLYLERHDGMIRVQQKLNMRLPEMRDVFSTLSAAQIYAEKDERTAIEIAKEIG